MRAARAGDRRDLVFTHGIDCGISRVLRTLARRDCECSRRPPESVDGNGNYFLPSDNRGRVIWLNFFATWCDPCNREASALNDFAHAHVDTVLVVGVDVEEPAEKARDFKKRLMHRISDGVYPTHVFLDANGRIACIMEGIMTPDAVQAEIDEAIRRTAPPTPPPFTSIESS